MTDIKTVQALPVVELLVQALEMGCPEDPHSIESQAIEAGKALIAQMQRDAVQPGWKLVPVEPTPEMHEVMLTWGTKRSEWNALLAAAPHPEAQALDSQLQQPDVHSTRASGVCASTAQPTNKTGA